MEKRKRSGKCDMRPGEKRATLAERGNQLYETPHCAVRALLEHEKFYPRIWEPACGRSGVIVNELREAGYQVTPTDLIDYGWSADFGARGYLDFLKFDDFWHMGDYGFDIVTNPPFSLAAEFVNHAIYDLNARKVAMLLRLGFMEAGTGKSKSSLARRSVLDGGQLARIYVFANRLPMMHRDGYTGKKSTSTQAYAWFIWESSYCGDTTIKRIKWNKLIDKA